MEIKKLIGIDMESSGGDTPEVKDAHEKLFSELKKFELDKKAFNIFENLIADYAMSVEEQAYAVGFDSAVSLLVGVKNTINSLGSGRNEA